MRLILKLVTAPIILGLILFTGVCSTFLYCSAYILGLIGTLIGLLGILVMVTDSLKNGLILLFIAYLVGPMGLPMAAAWLLGKVQDLRYTIQDAVW